MENLNYSYTWKLKVFLFVDKFSYSLISSSDKNLETEKKDFLLITLTEKQIIISGKFHRKGCIKVREG